MAMGDRFLGRHQDSKIARPRPVVMHLNASGKTGNIVIPKDAIGFDTDRT